MALIDHTNYASTLKESTNPAGSSPDGNVYFDTVNNIIQLIGVDELATVPGIGANPLTDFDGITMRALYNFENSRRRVNETLRKYKRGVKGSYRFAGAFNFVNGVKLRTTGKNDRAKVRGSGWIEYAASGDGETNVDRIYHGVLSLVDIQATTVPYYSLVTATDETTLQAATWTNFIRVGDINEAVQVYGSTANGDTGAGSFDYKTRTLVVRVRSWQYNPGETTSVATGIGEFSGFSAGYGVGESLNPSNTYTKADVIGGYAGQAGSRIAPWTGMSLEKYAAPQTVTGFNEGDGTVQWILHNTEGGTAQQCAAFLDALSLCDSDIDVGSGTYNGKKGRVWYSRNASGKIVTSAIGGEGLAIEGLSAAEKQNVILTMNNASTRTYPYFPSVEINVGALAVSDTNAWYRVMYVDGSGVQDFDTAGAVTVKDSGNTDVNGNVSANQAGNKISFAYSYDTNTQAGLSAGVNKSCVVIVEGDGLAGQAITYFTITRDPVIAVTCAPPRDNNA
jgi:hypothetical protein